MIVKVHLMKIYSSLSVDSLEELISHFVEERKKYNSLVNSVRFYYNLTV